MGASYNNDVLGQKLISYRQGHMRQMSASSLFPQVTADMNATKTYFSKNGPVFAIGPQRRGSFQGQFRPQQGSPLLSQVPQIQSLYNALFDASWEIDLFGKTRRTVRSSGGHYRAHNRAKERHTDLRDGRDCSRSTWSLEVFKKGQASSKKISIF